MNQIAIIWRSLLFKGTNHIKAKIYLTSESAGSRDSNYIMYLTVSVSLTHLPEAFLSHFLRIPLLPSLSPSPHSRLHLLPPALFLFFLFAFSVLHFLSVCFWFLRFFCVEHGYWQLWGYNTRAPIIFSNVKRRLFPNCVVKSLKEELWTAQSLVCGWTVIIGQGWSRTLWLENLPECHNHRKGGAIPPNGGQNASQEKDVMALGRQKSHVLCAFVLRFISSLVLT